MIYRVIAPGCDLGLPPWQRRHPHRCGAHGGRLGERTEASGARLSGGVEGTSRGLHRVFLDAYSQWGERGEREGERARATTSVGWYAAKETFLRSEPK